MMKRRILVVAGPRPMICGTGKPNIRTTGKGVMREDSGNNVRVLCCDDKKLNLSDAQQTAKMLELENIDRQG
jgi:hypothetical protein